MTNEEALRLLLQEVKDAPQPIAEACAVAAKELQSRIQKEPIFGDDVDSWFCPKCEHELMIYKQNACDECGQLLKWGEEK